MEEFIFISAMILAALLGLAVGSFLNVVIYRLPREMSLAFPPSHCTNCDYRLKWYDNIPVISWLTLGGKCRKCKEPISPRYIAVELVNAALWVLSIVLFWQESPVYAVASAVVSSVLICIFFIDLEHMLIYNRFVIIIAVAGIPAALFDSYTRPLDHIIGAVAAGGVFALLYYGAKAVLKVEAMGFGDVKLACAAGLFLGWQKLLFAVLIASVVGSIVLVTLNRVKNHDRRTEYPFGPFIVGGVLIAMLAGATVLTWYTDLIIG